MTVMFRVLPITNPGPVGSPPGPVTNLLLAQQGGVNNASAPVTASQKHTWGAPSGGAAPLGYRIYRGLNGAAFGPTVSGSLLADVGLATSYTDTTCTNSNDQTFSLFLPGYAYGVTAYNAVGEGVMRTPTTYFQQNGVPNQSQAAFSFGIPPASEQWGGTMAGRTCYIFNFNGGGAQPFSSAPLAGQYDLNLSPGYSNLIMDVCPGPTIVDQTLLIGRASRIASAGGSSDAFGWFAGVNIFAPPYTYGPAPIPNTWATYSIPLSVLGMGACTFIGSIVNGVLNVNSIVSGPGIVAAGGRIQGPGVPAGTIVSTNGQSAPTGTFGLFGAGISNTTNVAQATMQFQCWNAYKLGFARSGDSTPWSIGFDNFGFN